MSAEAETPTGVRRRLCRAPWTSLHLDPHGWVTACAANQRDALGNVADAPLIEIWRSRRTAEFRSSFADGGLAEGCDVCRWQLGSSGEETMYARIYDHLAVVENPAWPSHIEFAMSNRCNLQCEMCNGGLSSSIRANREGLRPIRSPYDDRFFESLPDVLEHLVGAKFLGGEPFLAPENHRTWAMMAASTHQPWCHVTTNGTVHGAQVAAALEALPMSFAVSMDGITAPTVESIRRGARFSTVMGNLDRFQEHTERHNTDLSLTYCLMVQNWTEFGDFLAFAEGRGLSAFVNTVLSPARFSLYQLPRDELAEVVAKLDAQTPRMERVLTRNLRVWTDQLDRLRECHDHPPNDTGVPVHFPSMVPLEPDGRPVGHDEASAGIELSTWSGHTAGEVTVGADGRILAAARQGLSGINLSRLVGLGIDELFVWLQSAFGRLDSSEQRIRSVDAGDRLLRFRSLTSTTEVRILSGRLPDDGAWWRLAAREIATGAVERGHSSELTSQSKST